MCQESNCSAESDTSATFCSVNSLLKVNTNKRERSRRPRANIDKAGVTTKTVADTAIYYLHLCVCFSFLSATACSLRTCTGCDKDTRNNIAEAEVESNFEELRRRHTARPGIKALLLTFKK